MTPASALASRRRGVLPFALKLGAVAAAAYGQATVSSRPWGSVAAFACGMALFIIAERLSPPAPPPAGEPAPAAPAGFWAFFAAGCALCVAAGILVYRFAAPHLTHPPWLLGLTLLASCALWSWWRARPVRRGPRSRLAAILLLLVLAGGLFGWRLTSIPPEVHGDEGEEGMDAISLMETKPFNLFAVGWYWLPKFHVLRMAAGMELFGTNLLGLRSTSVVVGAATVLLVFAVGYQLWGLEVGLLAGLVLVAARFFIHLSRTGLEYIDTPFLSILVIALAWRVWRDLRLDAAIWCGIAIGLGIQSYYASRLVPLLLTLTWGCWLVGSDPALRTARFRGFVVIAIVALATAAPMIGFFSNGWNLLWMRTRETSPFSASGFDHLAYGYGTRNLAYILSIQALHAVTLFNRTPDSSLQYGYRAGGLFDPVSAALFTLGLGALCARPLERRNLMVLVWIAMPVIVGGALTLDTPFYPRIAGAVPFAALAVALGLHSLLRGLREVLPRQTGRAVSAIVILSVFAVILRDNIRTYFFEYAPHHRHGPGVEISAWIHAHGRGKTTYMVGARQFYIKHGTIRFLTYGFETVDVLDSDEFLRHPPDPAKSLFIIMPEGRDLIPKLVAAVGPLDVKPHRVLRPDVDFYTAIPRAAEREPPEAARPAPG